eukprot:6212303-Pleurochrysis_carterae.AAC.1
MGMGWGVICYWRFGAKVKERNFVSLLLQAQVTANLVLNLHMCDGRYEHTTDDSTANSAGRKSPMAACPGVGQVAMCGNNDLIAKASRCAIGQR